MSTVLSTRFDRDDCLTRLSPMMYQGQFLYFPRHTSRSAAPHYKGRNDSATRSSQREGCAKASNGGFLRNYCSNFPEIEMLSGISTETFSCENVLENDFQSRFSLVECFFSAKRRKKLRFFQLTGEREMFSREM